MIEKEVHESTARLMEAAIQATAATTNPITDFAALTKVLGVDTAVMSNWKSRGVSVKGAVEAQRTLGISPVWILYGQEKPSTANAAWPPAGRTPIIGQRTIAKEEAASSYSIVSAVIALAAAIRDLSPTGRTSAMAVLSAIEKQPDDAEEIGHHLQAVLEAAKRKRA